MSLKYSGTKGNASIEIASQLTLELPNAYEIWENDGFHYDVAVFSIYQ